MTMVSQARSVVGAIVLLASTGSAMSQDVTGVLDMTGMSIYAEEDAVMEAAQGTVNDRGQAASKLRKPIEVDLSFVSSLEQRRKNEAQFVAKSRLRDPDGAAELERLFASQDIIDQINQQLGTYGFHANNVGDAYAAWWISAWLAVQGRTDDAAPAQIVAVRAQAAQALSSLPQMATASNAVKQEMAEAHLVQAALIGAYLDKAKGNGALLEKVSAAVAEGARASGLDLAAMELTEAGFVLK